MFKKKPEITVERKKGRLPYRVQCGKRIAYCRDEMQAFKYIKQFEKNGEFPKKGGAA